MEDWEQNDAHTDSPQAQFKLLSKYQDLHYIWPEDPYSAFTICSECLIWYHRKHAINKNWGWACILVPKGKKINMALIDSYSHEFIFQNNINENDNDRLQNLIAISSQKENVVVVDENKKIIKPTEHYRNYLGEFSKNDLIWENVPESNKINPLDVASQFDDGNILDLSTDDDSD